MLIDFKMCLPIAIFTSGLKFFIRFYKIERYKFYTVKEKDALNQQTSDLA